MKDLKKSLNIAGQSNNDVQKSQKHDANLQKNSTLYFQIGLILCLLGTYGLFEMRFKEKVYDQAVVIPLEEDIIYQMQNVVPEPDAPKEKQVKKRKKVISQTFVIKKNDDPIEETPNILDVPEPKSDPVDPNFFKKIEKPVEINKPYNLTNVQVVPIYPGCEKETTNEERVKCMSEKIGRLVQKKFDTGLASEHGLSGLQRINVQFKIDANGNITEILTRAPHPSLEKEAERVTKKIPQMKPGLQQEKPVSVVYNLPIVFKVN